MSTILTGAGTSHLTERANGETPENAFDGLVFGAGCDTPSTSDTLAEVSERQGLPVLRVANGYPKLGDTDSRNTGRGPGVWTWRFEREAGDMFGSTNVAVTNYSGGALIASAPLLVHSKVPAGTEPSSQYGARFDERLVVFVNASTQAAPSVVIARETALQNRVQRVQSFTARTRAMQNWPAGSVIDDTTTRVRTQPGQQVWTAAWLYGAEGRQVLAQQDIARFTLTVEEREADGVWKPLKVERPDVATHVLQTLDRTDQRWRGDGGYNVSHSWTPPRGTTEGTWRLSYEMELCDRDRRAWTTIVEVR